MQVFQKDIEVTRTKFVHDNGVEILVIDSPEDDNGSYYHVSKGEIGEDFNYVAYGLVVAGEAYSGEMFLRDADVGVGSNDYRTLEELNEQAHIELLILNAFETFNELCEGDIEEG